MSLIGCLYEETSIRVSPLIPLLTSVAGGTPLGVIALDLLDVFYEQGFAPISPIREYGGIDVELGNTTHAWKDVMRRTHVPPGEVSRRSRLLAHDIRVGCLSRTSQATIMRYLNDPDIAIGPVGSAIMAVPRLFATQTPQSWGICALEAPVHHMCVQVCFLAMGETGIATDRRILDLIPKALEEYLGLVEDDDARLSTCTSILTVYYLRLIVAMLRSVSSCPERNAILSHVQNLSVFLSKEVFHVR